ncbi:FAD dependent oxidoreductase-like protein superfamily [Dothidotthia symphoricarpi CBS 119687]|uniref:FAD dependent oxidoreductase-like protein superfamily n=1 Tax=Dothidotthia symphoricarpi CBS 119687 TaxID=1392245 RepID=A0A6A6AQD8_9PLEO|nr:FAD dependent oxidoreductase-like protein superfamily [Dothidotthia symphoricarpi CBS 119687]KAF2133164.1 FAD dependent oxidoreductase-like protein superfamily [Dothidotthia symphoricarpi CBS 119687]
MSPNTKSDTTTVILGSGIIGLCTAYYLSGSGNTQPESICLVDSSPELFRCASGLAGGFLAQDWFAPSVSSLGALSFKLHSDLASAYAGRATWGYAQSTGISLNQNDNDAAVSGSGEDWLENGTSRVNLVGHNRPWEEGLAGPEWLRCVQDGGVEIISRGGTTAQIDPLRFCRWLLERVKERGVHVWNPAKAVGLMQDESGVLNGVRISNEGEDAYLPCTRLVITAGAWTPRIFNSLFPSATVRIPISPLAGHSLLVRNPHFRSQDPEKEVCHAVFATDTLGFSPELFARLGGELYLAGLNTTMIPLPDVATDVKADEKAIEQLKQCARAVMSTVTGKEIKVLREGLCFRPVTSSGRPIVSRIPDERLGGLMTRGGEEGGVFIAAGHGAWGISHAPGTGLVLTELIEGRQTSAKIEALQLP